MIFVFPSKLLDNLFIIHILPFHLLCRSDQIELFAVIAFFDSSLVPKVQVLHVSALIPLPYTPARSNNTTLSVSNQRLPLPLPTLQLGLD